MASVVIENYRQGLDTRRSVLTSALGSLEVCRNAHINQGGEIEKRKAFVATDLTPTVASGVTILGVEALKSTIVIFGGTANADSGNWPPAGYTYQRLSRNPAVSAAAGVCDVAGTPNYCQECEDFATHINATGIIHSTVYNNKTWVLANMSDGSIAAFYDGEAIGDINYHGVMLADMNTVPKLWCAMVKAFADVEGYTVDLKLDNLGAVTGIEITGLPGREFSVEVDATGSMCSGSPPAAAFSSSTIQQVPGKAASGFFQIQDGQQRTGVNMITSVQIGDATAGWVELLTANIDYTDDPDSTAALVTANINANTATSGYEARNNGGTITIYAEDVGVAANTKQIKVTVAGAVIIGKCSLTFSGTGFTLNHIKANGADLLTAFNGVYPTSAETLSTFIARVADNIYGQRAVHGYTALARGDVLKISKLVTQSDPDPTVADEVPFERGMITIEVKLTPASGQTGAVSDADYSVLQAVVDRSPIVVYFPLGFVGRFTQFPQSIIGITDEAVRAIAIGGVPPYKYNWRIVDPENMSLSIENPSSPVTHISDFKSPKTLSDLIAKKATLYLDITDSQGQSATSPAISIQAARSS